MKTEFVLFLEFVLTNYNFAKYYPSKPFGLSLDILPCKELQSLLGMDSEQSLEINE